MRSRSKPAAQRSPNKSNPPARLNLWHGFFFFLGVCVTLLAVVLIPSTGHGSLSNKSLQAQLRPSAAQPWGHLDYDTIKLERPDESFPDTPPPLQPIVWWVPNLSQGDLEQLLRDSQLAPEQVQALASQSHWNPTSNGWELRPSIELVRDLSLPARKALYSVLGKYPQNLFIQNPVRIAKEDFDKWVSSSGLSQEHQQLLRKLCIAEDTIWAFYDGQLMEWLCSVPERKSLGKAASQTSALMMKLWISPQSDLDALLRYWGQGSRGKAMKPFLESLSRVPGGTSVSVSFFFPTFARMRLYTFPDVRNDALAFRQDCFWTAMNFFNEMPDYRFTNSYQIQATLKSDYNRVENSFKFGDVLMLVDSQKQAVHMCVYVADDVVYTKNGASLIAPWVLMKMPEMLKSYASEKSLQIHAYRKKEF